jgi:hypothetical protein
MQILDVTILYDYIVRFGEKIINFVFKSILNTKCIDSSPYTHVAV